MDDAASVGTIDGLSSMMAVLVDVEGEAVLIGRGVATVPSVGNFVGKIPLHRRVFMRDRHAHIYNVCEKVMNKRLHILLSVLTGLIAGAASLALIVGLANASIIWTFTHGHPYDPSAGDSAGWAFVFLSPVIFVAGVGVGVVVGLVAYSFARTRLQTSDQADR